MRQLIRVSVLALVVVQLLAGAAQAAFRNCEDDPDLAAAFRYDSEMNGGDRKTADRAAAEHYYLRYIARSTNSAQRARAFVQLGVLYSTNSHREKNETPDYTKCVKYMKKALAEEPVRLSHATLRARMFLATPEQSREERLSARIDSYRWLTAVADADTIERLWMPSVPAAGEARQKRDRETFLSLIRNVIKAEEQNLLADAAGAKDEKAALLEIAKRLPGTAVALEAARRSERGAEKKAP